MDIVAELGSGVRPLRAAVHAKKAECKYACMQHACAENHHVTLRGRYGNFNNFNFNNNYNDSIKDHNSNTDDSLMLLFFYFLSIN